MDNVTCIIQARTGSKRLPDKILLPLPFGSNTSVLSRVIARVKKIKSLTKIVIATTNLASDDPIIKIASKEKVEVFRGSESNLLSRYYQAAKQYQANHIVRITSDCPCIDYTVSDQVIKKHLNEGNDYTSNVLDRSFPRGLDTEVFTMQALSKTYKLAKAEFEKEHVTPFIIKTRSDLFKLGNITNKKYKPFSKIRLTLDTKQDYILLSAIYGLLGGKASDFNLDDVLKLFEKHQWLNIINSNIEQKDPFK